MSLGEVMTSPSYQPFLNTAVSQENLRIALEILKEVLPQVVEILRERFLEQTAALNLLSQKIDQLVTREIYAGFSSIKDAIDTTNAETKQLRLRFAEEQLLKNTHLDPELKTGSRKNSYWMAQSHYGLMNICLIREDSKIAYKHLLSIFRYDPRLARTKLIPEIWEKIFKPECKEIYNWFDEESKKIENNKYTVRVALDRTFAVAKFAGKSGFVASMWLLNSKTNNRNPTINTSSMYALTKAQEELSEEWEEISPEEHRFDALYKLREQLDNKIDSKCCEYAKQLIAAI